MKRKLSSILAVVLAAGLLTVPAVSANASNAALKAEIAQIKKDNKKFTYWIGLIFSDEANALAVEQINDWAAMRGIQANPILVNQNNLNAQVTAAITAGTMPDAMDASAGLMLQLGDKNLLNVQSTLDALIKKNGQLNNGAKFFNSSAYAAKGLGVPYGINGNLINRRLDLIKTKKAPATWEELLTMGKSAMPSGGGWGFNTGNTGDAEGVFRAMFR